VEKWRHLLWECREAKKVWQAFNEFMTYINKQEKRVKEFENVFKIGNMGVVSKVKIRDTWRMIHVQHPINIKIMKVVNEIKWNF
jgi:hypothetical protein